MRFIPLTKGFAARVDDEWYEALKKYNWMVDSKGYAVRWSPRKNYKRHNIYMHRIVNNTPNGFETDHVDRDRLNNQSKNLRTVNHSQNSYNKLSKGYGWHKASRKWRAYIDINGKHKHLGLFNTEAEAKQKRETAWKSTTLT